MRIFILLGFIAFSANCFAQNQDCATKRPICDTKSFADNNNGSGGVRDLNAGNQGCLFGENQSSWYTFKIATGGTFNFDISPVDPNIDDYDFAVWGPNPNCPPTTQPNRCNYAQTAGITGVGPAGVNASEGSLGLLYSKTMNVLAGEVYILMVDNFSNSNQGFQLSFSGTATLDCAFTVTPITLVAFSAVVVDSKVLLTWATATEKNSSYFMVEKSKDGSRFEALSTPVKAAGNSDGQLRYSLEDLHPYSGQSYYRLKQVDIDGNSTYSKVVNVLRKGVVIQNIYPNPATNSDKELSISFNASTDDANTRIELFDVIGKLYYSAEQQTQTGENAIKIPLNSGNMPTGVYFLRITDESGSINQKIVLQ